ncbi:RagB/SusD family nutrient uptake outer membrane protein [Flavitalea sp. BT771]|uniref:RagB/SusD family nutrient uptake outer membrane protein n=1 Tax=Flavitalea sp. BT771 TaxID=3063329 RepID=UPI0026E2D2F7|nr:RagB/SusD family nutrient uptake outer membrane protein [Flavitalea sp. BT771]MDO6431679.1 RagB/SusD family nutrient uptake outer membrane protein [Flavitalea sp. BT771]MDV6220587.1 RagB/SusD family nutrient uptake outer membrane protein [Flavitalea sp. BT771]
MYPRILTILLFALSLASCRKYVEDAPVQGQRVLVYTDDYRALMDNPDKQEVALGMAPQLSCDDLDLADPAIASYVSGNTIQQAMYTWAKPFYQVDQSDYDWNTLYSAMYVYNVVINGVLGSKGGDLTLRNDLLGEALIQRAFTYFMLVNTYARQYDASTAAKDPGVPVLLKPALFVDLTRASVQATYDRILADIRQAIPLLPGVQQINSRAGKAAAYALLSKVYLNMRDFANAAVYADSTLAISGNLYDYNTAVAANPYIFPAQFNDVQVLLRKVPRQTFGAPQLSQSLLNLLGTKDLRYMLFVRTGDNFYPAFSGMGFWPRNNYAGYPDASAVGLTVNETWLIKAECLARGGKKDEAVAMLNTLRKFRFLPADYVDLTAATADDALQLVVDERRREFFGTGLRWFDQRRLDKDPLFAKAMVRTLNGTTYTLASGSNSFVFPLAPMLIAQNPELKQNP